MKNSILGTLLVPALITSGAILGLSSDAHGAEVVVEITTGSNAWSSGKPYNFADSSCFSQLWTTYGAVTNTCASSRTWIIPANNVFLPGYAYFWSQVMVTTSNAPGGSCYIATTSDPISSPSLVYVSASQSMNGSGLLFSNFGLGANFNATDVVCVVPQNGIVGMVRYAQNRRFFVTGL